MLEMTTTIAKIELRKYGIETKGSAYTKWYYTITDTQNGNSVTVTEEEGEALYYALGNMVKQGRLLKR